MKTSKTLADVDPTFRCVMKKPTRKTKLSSVEYTYGSGTMVTLPSRAVLVFDSGEVWVAKGDSHTRRRVHSFVSLSSLVEQAKKKKHTVLTNYSK